MSRWMPERLRLALRWPAEHRLWLTPEGVREIGAPEPAQQSWPAWCAGHRGSRCRLFASAACLHLVDADPALGLRGDQALAAYAQAQLLQYHGSVAAGWPLQAWSAGGRGGASALHQPELGTLLEAAREHGVQLVGLHPGWRWALAAAQGQPGGLASDPGTTEQPRLWILDEGRVATVLVLDGEGLRSARIRRCPGTPPHDPQAWRRLAEFGDDVPLRVIDLHTLLTRPQPMGRLANLRGPASGRGLLGPAVASPMAWLAAGAAVALLLATGLDATQAWTARSRAMHAATTATLSGFGDSTAALQPPTEAPAWQGALQHSWRAVFTATEAASLPGVHWLSQEHAGDASRLQARVPDLDAALAVAQALQRQPGVRNAEVEHMAPGADGVQTQLRVHWLNAAPAMGAAR